MFTGIVEEKGLVHSLSEGEVKRLVVSKPEAWEFKIGGSVSVDGTCLTVVEQTDDTFSADVMPETLSRTTIASYKTDQVVNLERPLRLGDELGGHMVQGHVDTTVPVIEVKERGVSREITFKIPDKYQNYVIEKRSIAINGVSLTIARTEPSSLTIALIPHTLKETNLGDIEMRNRVNVEFETAEPSVARGPQK